MSNEKIKNQIIGLEGIESEEKVWLTPEKPKPIALLEELDKVLVNEPASRHSYFQLKYFLVGKEPTNQGKMWQCLREMKTRRESLVNMDLEVADTKDRLELLDIKIKKIKNPQLSAFGIDAPDDEFYKKEQAISLRQAERQKRALEASLLSLAERKRWLEEESKFFLETFKNIQKNEPLKPFDDIEAQKQYWGEKLAQKLNLKMLTSNQLDSDLIETIVSLPDDVPLKRQTLATLNARHAHMVQQIKETVEKLESK